MKKLFANSAFLALLIVVTAISCSKKEETAAVPEAPPQEAPVADQPAAAQPVAIQEIVTADQPLQDVPAPKVALTEAQAAIKAKNFERAQAILQSNPRTPVRMTGEQLMSRNQALADLYKEASAAAAAGDPRAKAVLEKMRKEAEHR